MWIRRFYMKLAEILDDFPDWAKTPEYRSAVKWLDTYAEGVNEDAGEVITLEDGVFKTDVLRIDNTGYSNRLEYPPFKVNAQKIVIESFDLSDIENFDWIQRCDDLVMDGDETLTLGKLVPSIIQLCKRMPELSLILSFNANDKIQGGISQIIDLPNPLSIYVVHPSMGFSIDFEYFKTKYDKSGTLQILKPTNSDVVAEYKISSVFEFQDAMINHGLEKYL
ncbi:hypothetical protein RsoM2USA_328 [Ralstonia phage RsoM2USA]|nr:hypothetical protein RsoM2USA_328 [Ralstonia phage RsoM2USA]